MSGTGAGGFVTVATVGEIPPGGVKVTRIADQEIAVFNIAGAYHAMDDVCTHDGGPLALLLALPAGLVGLHPRVLGLVLRLVSRLVPRRVGGMQATAPAYRMVLLMLGCTGRIVQTMGTATASEQRGWT